MSWKLPTGRKVEEADVREGFVGSIGPLRAHTKVLDKVLRRHIREIAASDLEQHGKVWTDRVTGEEFSLVTSFVDAVDPKGSAGVEAYAVLDNCTIYFRPLNAVAKTESTSIGSVLSGGEQVSVETGEREVVIF